MYQTPLNTFPPPTFLTKLLFNPRNYYHSIMSLTRSHSQWPRGIPSFIRRHEEPVARKNFDAASRAWRHFVREQWVGGDGADQQKRALIERWATADQQFRDVCLLDKNFYFSLTL